MKKLKIGTIILGVVIYSLGILMPILKLVFILYRLTWFPYVFPGDVVGIGSSWNIGYWDPLVIVPLLGMIVVFVGSWWKKYRKSWLLMLILGVIWVITFSADYVEAFAGHKIAIDESLSDNNIVIDLIQSTINLIPGIFSITLGLILRNQDKYKLYQQTLKGNNDIYP